MEGPSAANLRIWSGWTRNSVGGRWLPPSATRPTLLPRGDEYYFAETMSSRRPRHLPTAEPYSLQWFLNIEAPRHGRQGKWIPRLLEFAKHSGETTLGLGDTLGTDWVQYARHGASVVACALSPEYLELTRRNFDVRGLKGRFLHCAPGCLPLESSSIDVVCVSSFMQEEGDPQAVVREIYRVLQTRRQGPGIIPAKYDVDFWFSLCFPWTRLFVKRRPPTDGAKYSRRRLKKLFRASSNTASISAQLRRSDVRTSGGRPADDGEHDGPRPGLKAFKPVSAPSHAPLAA